MVGERLRALRTSRGLTQEALERASGVEQTTISGIELGRRKNPQIETIARLADGLGVEIACRVTKTTSASCSMPSSATRHA
jgi:transcriptional regulator with XRE-family HTH domain